MKTYPNPFVNNGKPAEEIACKKLLAITSRPTEKGFTDLYFLLQKMSLKKLLRLCKKKAPAYDEFLLLKSLVYWEELEKEKPVASKDDLKISWEEMKKYFEDITEEYVRQMQLETVRKNQIEKDKGIEK